MVNPGLKGPLPGLRGDSLGVENTGGASLGGCKKDVAVDSSPLNGIERTMAAADWNWLICAAYGYGGRAS